MAETLVELVARISTDATELKKGLAVAERGTEQSSRRMADSLKKVGMAMAGMGAAMTAALGLMGKAAIDEEINIKRLATTMDNVGVSYDKVKDSLEAVIAATQRKTGVADDEQRDILNRLILVTNDYNKALELLPTALNLAAAGGMDATTAATYLGKAFLDLENGADSVSVRFGQASLQFKSMEDIQNRVAGAAENLVNPLEVLKASMSDLSETIGANLIPLVKGLTSRIADISIRIQEWTKEHPELTKAITVTALALGGLTTAAGGLILILPALISGIAAFGAVLHAALGPIGLISLAITALTAGGIALAIAIGDMMPADEIKRDAKSVVDSTKQMGAEVIKITKRMTDAIKTELERQKADALSAVEYKKQLAQEGFNYAIEQIKAEYGEYKTNAKSKMELARDASNAEKQALRDSFEEAQRVHNEKLSLLEKEYDQRIKTLNSESDFEIQQIQNQIDALNKQSKQEDLILARDNEKKRLDELQSAIDRAEATKGLTLQAEEEIAKARARYNEYAAEVARKELLRQREDETGALRNRIQDIRKQTKTKEDALKAELEASRATLKEQFAAFKENQSALIEELNSALDIALRTELVRLEDEKTAKLELEQAKLDSTLDTLIKEENALITSFAARLTEAAIYQAALESTLKDVTQTVTLIYTSAGSPPGGGATNRPGFLPGFAAGGIVPGPA